MSQETVSRGLTERQQFWQEHLRRCEVQGLMIKAYAEAHGLSVAAMYAAKRDIARKRSGAASASKSLTLVPVKTHNIGGSRAPAMRVRFPGGVEAEVSAEVAAEVSAALMRTVLEGAR